nr:MAG TPA: hypothetical protein [Caudoviricetes sp.]
MENALPFSYLPIMTKLESNQYFSLIPNISIQCEFSIR